MNMISKAASYAIQSLSYLTTEGTDREYIPISEIAEKLGIPYYFLKKVLADLVTAGMLRSYRSAKGGVALASPPSEITLLDIISRVDGTETFEDCILGLPGCGDSKPCALHAAWAIQRARLLKMYSEADLASIASRLDSGEIRVSK